jgi:hypothetical protein
VRDLHLIPLHQRDGCNVKASKYEGRLAAALHEGEMILHAKSGWLVRDPTLSGGKRLEGLVLLTNERVLLVRPSGVLSKDPTPVFIPYESIFQCGQHRDYPWKVVILTNGHRGPVGYHIDLTSSAHPMLAQTWALTIEDSAESAGGPQNRPAGM